MGLFQIGAQLVDTRTGEICQLIFVASTRKGTLYTVQYNDRYGRHYTEKLEKYFQPSQNETNNVIYVDFKHRRIA